MNNFYIEFGVVDNFAVKLESAVVKCLDGDLFCRVFATPIRADMFAFEEFEKTEDDFALFISLT